MSRETRIPFDFDGEAFEHVLVGRRDSQRRPTVILFPTVAGVSDLEIGFGRQLVELGYNGLVADLFGTRLRGAGRAEKHAAMSRLRSDRAALRQQLLAVLDLARTLPEVDEQRVAAAGFCFGGQCALDLARSGADIAAAVSFHGLFDPPALEPLPIRAKVAAFHGWDDPMVPPEEVVALARELTEAGADWQIHAYGQTAHGFTNPGADALNVPGVRYNAQAAERAWTSLINLLEEVFGDHG